MVKRLYIDSDSLLYRAAHINNCKDDALNEAMAIVVDGNDEQYLESLDELEDAVDIDTMEAMISTFNSMVREIVVEVEADANAKGYEMERNEFGDIEPILVLTVKGSSDRCEDLDDNFRYEVMESVEDVDVKGYKSNRAGMEVPEGLLEIYNYVFDLENCICLGGVEADDVVVYYGQQGHIVAALDKDVLGSLEYAYNFGKLEWIENTKEEIAFFPYYQTLTGDSSDGLRGVYRVGDKKARAILEGLTDPLAMWTAVVKTYFSKEQSLEEAIATMRCVRMDMWSPNKGLVYWQPPKRSN